MAESADAKEDDAQSKEASFILLLWFSIDVLNDAVISDVFTEGICLLSINVRISLLIFTVSDP